MRPWFAQSWKRAFLIIGLNALMSQSAQALTATQVYQQVKDSVVIVKAYDQQGNAVGLGSGVMLPSGDIVTNYHVAKAGVRYTVGRGQKVLPAHLKAGDPDKDLCLLTVGKLNIQGFRKQFPMYNNRSDQELADGLYRKYFSEMDRGEFDAKFLGKKPTLNMSALLGKPAHLGKAANLKVGEPVYAVGAPEGLELSLSEGIISQLRGGGSYPIIQTTAAISPGSSGGGLFNSKGELVGITTFYLKESQGLNFALPVEWIGQVARVKIQERSLSEAPGTSAPGARPQKVWLNGAAALQKSQDWPKLLAWCRLWSNLEPGDALAWASLALAYGEMGRHREAIEAYREALRLKPDYHDAWYNLGTSYERMGRYREAIEAFREALRLNPDDAGSCCNLGVAYEKLGRHEEAIKVYREALRLKPDYSNAWYNLGTSYAKMGRYREAIEAFREALRLKPDYGNVWGALALAYAVSGNRSAALEAVRELRRYDPKGADELLNFIVKP
jgi:S1-C subfamily serine protease/Flp pilus assembly protein TadD